MEIINLPTGHIIIDEYSHGKLETLSIGDYGKARNIKADFLGFYDEVNGVSNGSCARLSEKWVMTLSTQYGCVMSCKFCDAHNIKFAGNVDSDDLKAQVMNAINLNKDVTYTDRLNIHLARMGEPMFNGNNIFNFASWLGDKYTFQHDTELRVETIHPVFTTMMPVGKSDVCHNILREWIYFKNEVFRGQAGLQLSINSTNDEQRNDMFNNNAMDLVDISAVLKKMPKPLGRKYCLNFAYADGYEINAQRLAFLFDPKYFMCKITPIHNNNACKDNNIKTTTGYSSYESYRKVENDLKRVGFDVLVFVPSMDEENGCVTCGNAILGGSTLKL